MKKTLSIFAFVLSVVLLCTALVSPAMAAKSPEAKPTFKIDITSFATGKEAPGKYIIEGDTVRLIASEDSKYEFMGWYIEGEYEIVSGDLMSKVLVIRPLSDIKVEEMYNVEGSKGYIEPDKEPDQEPDEDKKPTKPNKEPEAPKTSDNTLTLASMLVLFGLAVMLYSKKRLAA